MTATIKEIPLLFQTEMVQAIMEGRKTQTRRTKGLESKNEHPDNWNRDGNPLRELCRLWDSTKEANPNPLEILHGFKYPGWQEGCDIVYQSCPYGKPGDLLWVRETWAKLVERYKDGSLLYQPEGFKYVFKADNVFMKNWKPSIHMPKSACRIWLMVEDIRVERLQDITEEDAVAEGIKQVRLHEIDSWKRYDGYNTVTSSPVVSFWSLWASINGEDSWQANPWVWVVKFRVLSKTGRPTDEAIQAAYERITNK